MGKRLVYIGQGKIIEVEDLDKKVNILDIYKVKEMLEKYGEVTVGASTDWFFTAGTLTKEDIPALLSGKKYLLRASSWDSFKILLPDEEELDATITADEKVYWLAYVAGFSDAAFKLRFWFDVDIIFDLINKLEYEQMKELTKEIKPILKKYEKLTMEEDSDGRKTTYMENN